jgi:hypothetical protein
LNRICLISDTRSGSTVISDFIAKGLDIPDLGEIFYPIGKNHEYFPNIEYNYYYSWKEHNGNIFEYFDWLHRENADSFIAKIMYHDFVIGLLHPVRLDGNFPIIQHIPHIFNNVIHLNRVNKLDCALSEIIAVLASKYHNRTDEPNLSSSTTQKKENLIDVDLEKLSLEMQSRENSFTIFKIAMEYCRVENMFNLTYEDFFLLGKGRDLLRQYFANFSPSMQPGFSKVVSDPKEYIKNYDEICTRFLKK